MRSDRTLGPGSGEIDRDGRIDYRVRTSTRARSVRLTLSPREGLTVVVPQKFDLRRVPAIVEKKRTWIENHLRRFAEDARVEASSGAVAEAASVRRLAAVLPESLDLPALGETWKIDYRRTTTRYVGVMVDGQGRLAVYGAIDDQGACREALKGWLRLRAREELVPWLERLAGKAGFRFREAQIKGQKTRWASCSSKGTVNLSFKLLFLEREWVRCVLQHELCHTVCMNHSPRFWALLGRLEPECRAIHKLMRDGWRRVPSWVEERVGG